MRFYAHIKCYCAVYLIYIHFEVHKLYFNKKAKKKKNGKKPSKEFSRIPFILNQRCTHLIYVVYPCVYIFFKCFLYDLIVPYLK